MFLSFHEKVADAGGVPHRVFQPDAVDEPDTTDATFIVAALAATEREVVHVVVVSAIGRPTVVLPARA